MIMGVGVGRAVSSQVCNMGVGVGSALISQVCNMGVGVGSALISQVCNMGVGVGSALISQVCNMGVGVGRKLRFALISPVFVCEFKSCGLIITLQVANQYNSICKTSVLVLPDKTFLPNFAVENVGK